MGRAEPDIYRELVRETNEGPVHKIHAYCMLVLPPSHNISDFDFLLVTFDHSSYSKIFKIINYFICDLLYYL